MSRWGGLRRRRHSALPLWAVLSRGVFGWEVRAAAGFSTIGFRKESDDGMML